MVVYVDEEEAWKCPKHPSKRPRHGICALCLRDRLNILCPNCAHVRPCACSADADAAATSSSSSSSSFSLFSSSASGGGGGGDGEPSFRRSRSLAIPFLRSRSRFPGERQPGGDRPPPPPAENRSRSSGFWSVFRTHKNKKGGEEGVEVQDDYAHRMMMRSRSVSVPVVSNRGGGGSAAAAKGRGWHFTSPMKAFRQSKTSNKVVQERSPLQRG